MARPNEFEDPVNLTLRVERQVYDALHRLIDNPTVTKAVRSRSSTIRRKSRKRIGKVSQGDVVSFLIDRADLVTHGGPLEQNTQSTT